MKRKSKRKGRKGKILLLFILIGIGLSLLFIFHQEIFNSLKPWLEKWSILEEKKGVFLYFSEREGEYLIGEKREILKRSEVKEEAKETIVELIKGPKGKLIPTLPPQTKLLSLQFDEEGVAKVNFNKALSKDHPGGSSGEMMTVYSIVNSLTLNFPQIKRVQILIEGKAIETIAGHLSLKQPVSSNRELIKKMGKKRGND
jgi:spore germination protein GerM